MQHVLHLRESKRQVAISYDLMLKYHGEAHPGGVAVAFKVLEAAFARLCPNDLPERNRIRLVVGINAPGVVDGLECATRAFSRYRAIIDTRADKGQLVCGERFYFEVHHKGAAVCMWLKDGTIDAEFLSLIGKQAGGTASPADVARLTVLRDEMARKVLSSPATDLFEFADAA